MIKNVIQSFLGTIRVPKTFKLEGKLNDDNTYELHYEAEHIDGRKANVSKTYTGIYHTAESVLDLVEWLKATSKTFFGSP